mmetsp:Transcript_67435/g.133043  ORF Transcript_67435/g.133043 Transcript_67435/m.133043 type:complete len:264 (+) Transcript_67435:60-851(+)
MDLTAVRNFVKHRTAGKLDMAVQTMAPDITWHAVSRELVTGREGVLALWKKQEAEGMRNSQVASWSVVPEYDQANQDGLKYDDDASLTTYIARRMLMITTPEGAFEASQTASVKNGVIIRVAVTRCAQRPEPDTNPRELCNRFTLLRVEGDNEGAAMCLSPDVDWIRFQDASLFAPSEAMSDPHTIGRERVIQLWTEQVAQGLERHPTTVWMPDSGTDLFSREMLLKNPSRTNKVKRVKQYATVKNGFICKIDHANLADTVDD